MLGVREVQAEFNSIMAKAERTSVALLVESDPGQAVVKMKDGDVFFVAVSDAARACQAIEKFKDFSTQFRALLAKLGTWVEAHRSGIKSAYLTIREHDMLFLTVQKSVEFDALLADSLSDLDLEIANGEEFNLLDLSVMAIPAVSEGSLNAFLSSGEVFTYAQ